jgi:hypothetical protein
VDWLIGSVFHEAMKLKENIYLLNTYGPAGVQISQRPERHFPGLLHQPSSTPQMSQMLDVQGLISRVAGDVQSQIEQIGHLLGQTNYILRMMMPELNNNPLVVRLLVEREELIHIFWGERLEELFSDMFHDNPAAGFCLAGRSYMESQWYNQALTVYERALAIDSNCEIALIKTAQVRSILAQNEQLIAT